MSKYEAPPPAYTEAIGGYPQPQGYPQNQGYQAPKQGYQPAQVYPTNQGFQPPIQQGYPQGYSQSAVSTNNVVVITQPTTAVVVGGCGSCGGHLSEEFTAIGIILAICFFPLGVICCFLLMEKRCDRCGRRY